MSDTPLQIAKQRVSELKLQVLKQKFVVASLRREAGPKLEAETDILNFLQDELDSMERRLKRLVVIAS
jgi:hypothetical protein